jgi:hypothetical protein
METEADRSGSADWAHVFSGGCSHQESVGNTTARPLLIEVYRDIGLVHQKPYKL